MEASPSTATIIGLFVKHKAADRSLVEWKREVFSTFTTMQLHEFEQQLNGRGYPCVQFVTRTDPVFTVWRKRFYVDRRKIVPPDIEDFVTPMSVAVWLMDDGTADRADVSFQTHSFERTEVERLATLLQDMFGLKTSLMQNHGASIVYVHGSSLEALKALVAPYVLPQFAYKLIPRGTWTP